MYYKNCFLSAPKISMQCKKTFFHRSQNKKKQLWKDSQDDCDLIVPYNVLRKNTKAEKWEFISSATSWCRTSRLDLIGRYILCVLQRYDRKWHHCRCSVGCVMPKQLIFSICAEGSTPLKWMGSHTGSLGFDWLMQDNTQCINLNALQQSTHYNCFTWS